MYLFPLPTMLGSGNVEFLIPNQGYFCHSAQTMVSFIGEVETATQTLWVSHVNESTDKEGGYCAGD